VRTCCTALKQKYEELLFNHYAVAQQHHVEKVRSASHPPPRQLPPCYALWPGSDGVSPPTQHLWGRVHHFRIQHLELRIKKYRERDNGAAEVSEGVCITSWDRSACVPEY